jgi:hypothetical protein
MKWNVHLARPMFELVELFIKGTTTHEVKAITEDLYRKEIFAEQLNGV